MKNVLIIDDDLLIHEALGAVVRRISEDAIVRCAADLSDGFAKAREAEPLDLVLLDLGLPGCTGMEALTTFRDWFPHVRVVVVSVTEEAEVVLKALRAGASGYVPKTHNAGLMTAALRVVAEGGVYVPPQALAEVKPADPTAIQGLTDRQRDVLRLIVRGLPNRAIAERLGIAEDTVKQHASAAYAALGVSSRTQAMVAVAKAGIRLD